MKYMYTEKDLDLIYWKRIDKFVNKIFKDVCEFIDSNNLKMKFISPIVRGGNVPATIVSHMFNCVDMLPLNFKIASLKEDSLDCLGLAIKDGKLGSKFYLEQLDISKEHQFVKKKTNNYC